MFAHLLTLCVGSILLPKTIRKFKCFLYCFSTCKNVYRDFLVVGFSSWPIFFGLASIAKGNWLLFLYTESNNMYNRKYWIKIPNSILMQD